MNNIINIFNFYEIISDIKYSKKKITNKLKKICSKKIINNKTLYFLLLIIQDYVVCLYFDINPFEKTNITIFLSCDNIKFDKGIDIVSAFDINFKKNIAEDDYITKYKSVLNNKYIEKQGLFNIHIILLLCRIFGVSKYIINDSSNIWVYNFIKYRKSYYQRIGFVPLYTKKYNKALKIINKLTINEYKQMFYQKFKKYPNIKMLKGKNFIKSLEKLSNKSNNKEILLSSLVFLNLFNIFDLTNLQYKFNKIKYILKITLILIIYNILKNKLLIYFFFW